MTAKDIKKVACVGAGLIGSSWAALFAKFGLDVNVFDISEEALKDGESRIEGFYQIFVDNGYMTADEMKAAMARVSYFTNLEDAVRDVQFIQENVAERLDVKQELLEKIDAVNTTAIIASSTSGLNLSDIAAKTPYANRCIGGHPFNPPHLMPLVEITQWEKTDPNMVQVGKEFYTSLNRKPVVLLKETPGFIGNRLQGAFVKEAIQLVMEGVCSVEDVDIAAVYGLGIRWAIVGPNLNGDLNGGANGAYDYFGPKFGPNLNMAFKRILASDISEVPEEYYSKLVIEGVASELANRTPREGKDRASVMKYRDKILMEILHAQELL